MVLIDDHSSSILRRRVINMLHVTVVVVRAVGAGVEF